MKSTSQIPPHRPASLAYGSNAGYFRQAVPPTYGRGDLLLLLGGAVCLVYSWILVATMSLDQIPPAAYIPVFGFVVGCLLFNHRTFVFGWLLVGILSTIGSFELVLRHAEFVTRDLHYSFASFRTGFVNLGLGNTALILAGVFVARYYISFLDLSVRLFWFPGLLIAFSILQYLLHPGYLGLTISNRSIIVCLFVCLAIAYLPWNQLELQRVVRWSVYLVAVISFFFLLRVLGSDGGRSVFVFMLASIPLAVYLYKQKTVASWVLLLAVILATGYAFVFGTYWWKIMILTSFVAVFALPFVQRYRFFFWILPIFSVALPLTAPFLEPEEDLGAIAQQIRTGREDVITSIGDLTAFSFSEIRDLVMYKYKTERAGLWQSSLRHTFYPLSLNTIVPDPSAHFILYTRTGSMGLWMNGPHHGFLWLLRVYGLVFGIGLFVFIYWLLYRAVMVPMMSEPMRWVMQPFLLAFATAGFHVGDYPLNSSGSYLVFAILGLALAANRVTLKPHPKTLRV